MIIVDFNPIYSFLSSIATTLDFKFAYSFFIVFCTVECFLSLSVKALREEKITFSFVRVLSYLSVCLFSLAMAIVEAREQAKTFQNLEVAVFSSVILFVLSFGVYLILFFSIKKKVDINRQKYVAKVYETEEQMRFCEMEKPIKIYPLKTKKLKEFVRHDFEINFNEVKQHLTNLSPLCYNDLDNKEFSRLNEKASFLEGVEINKTTVKDFNELFLDIVKLTSRLECEI